MIEFQYFEGCPNAVDTLNNLKHLAAEGFIYESEIIMTEVPSLSLAEEKNFQGSPTILYNGYDIYTEAKPESFCYTCRIYHLDGVTTGILSKEYIKQQIEKLRKL
ncbi:MAG: alkylmercury lyase [Candidatus Cloacimonetes bacterium HGW-Cloacimonetes-1]|jgi:hypothetical protein|nr:MAG: alkylmercury lyase [Candidatus Cloacimonetes bacterium HGW-Cloacimonetes-1]